MRSCWKRLSALSALVLAPLCLGPVPTASAGGGFGITVTATMDGQGQRLLAGTVHTVHVTVLDVPGEASLRDITVSVVDPDPTTFPVVCDKGTDGHLSLEPMRALHCTAEVTALDGPRSVVASATARVPGIPGQLRGSATLTYVGFTPPAPPKPAVKAHVKAPAEAPVAKKPPVSQAGDPPAAAKPQAPAQNAEGGDPAGDPPAADCPPDDASDPGADWCHCPPDGAADPESDLCHCPVGDGDPSSEACCPDDRWTDAAAGHCQCPPGTSECDPDPDHVGAAKSSKSSHSLARTGTDVALVGSAALLLLGGGLFLTRRARRP